MERVNTELQRVNDLLSLRVLRAQLNPHFIHNCQNSAIALVKEGKGEEALRYMQGLSKLMRAVLEHSVTDNIALEDELVFLREYLILETLRLPGLSWKVEADPSLLEEEVLVPALLVQPFVENALWHGLANKPADREVQVRFTKAEAGLRCTVTDNGVGREVAAATPGDARSMATVLTQERLQLLTHRMHQRGSIRIEDRRAPDGRAAGTEVTIALQL
jgi:LytS/YehU family sensor histidine kinase